MAENELEAEIYYYYWNILLLHKNGTMVRRGAMVISMPVGAMASNDDNGMTGGGGTVFHFLCQILLIWLFELFDKNNWMQFQ